MLFKYATSKRLDILANERIRVTPPAGLNDPFDLKPYFTKLFPEAFLRGELEKVDPVAECLGQYDQSDQLRSMLSRRDFEAFVRAVMTTPEYHAQFRAILEGGVRAIAGSAPEFRKTVHEQMERIGILSVSEVPDHPLMWAHYADNHTGVVLALETSHPSLNRRRSAKDEFFHFRKVMYRDPDPNASLLDLANDALFVQKSLHWEYEREWRMLVPLELADDRVSALDPPPLAFLRLPAAAVHAVIVGARASQETLAALAQLINGDGRFAHVQVWRASLDRAKARVEIVKSDQDG